MGHPHAMLNTPPLSPSFSPTPELCHLSLEDLSACDWEDRAAFKCPGGPGPSACPPSPGPTLCASATASSRVFTSTLAVLGSHAATKHVASSVAHLCHADAAKRCCADATLCVARNTDVG